MSIVIPLPVRRLAAMLHADLPGRTRMPGPARFLLAAAVALGLSLLACLAVADLAVVLLPSLRDYDHLRVGDWARLTAIGVPLACLGWPFAAALWSSAGPPFLVLTGLVTLASLVPDLWILAHGQPPAGVLALAIMHVGVAVVTFLALVVLAPQDGRRPRSERRR